jgi:signal transduction histidine kinase
VRLRAVLVILLTIVALLQIQALAVVVTGQARATETFAAPARARAEAAAPRLSERLQHGRGACVREARRLLGGAGAVVLVDEAGRCLAADPAGTCAPDAFLPRRLTAARHGSDSSPQKVIVVGPTPGLARVLLYVPVTAGGAAGRAFVRVGLDGAALAEDARERRHALVLHGAALVLGLIAAALLLLPDRRAPAARTAALDAYEAAMDRLQAQGSERARSHQVEVQRLQDTLRDREAMARAGELTSGIVHEVRNGLGTISGYLRLLERASGDAGGETAELLGALREECGTLDIVVRRIADFVRWEELRPAVFDVRHMVERVVARENRRPGPQAALLGGEPVSLVADEDLLERAVENLVRNAREAAGASGSVVVETREEGDEVVLSVEDDGPGLPPAVEGGFRPFLTTKPGGLGLGLSMALKLVTLHGGCLDLSAKAPHGLRATMRLPRTKPLESDTSGDNMPDPARAEGRGA